MPNIAVDPPALNFGDVVLGQSATQQLTVHNIGTGALSDRLTRLVSDRHLAARLGANARDLVTERFTWRACAERCLAAYQTLLTSPRPRPR